MQISAANFLIAAQQAAKPAAAKPTPAFEPLPFQQTAAPEPAKAAAPAKPAALGSQVDIRV